MIASMSASGSGVITAATVNVSQFEWSGNGTASDSLILIDNNGRIVWQAVAPGSQYDMFKTYARPVAIFGLNLAVIQSGILVIYYV